MVGTAADTGKDKSAFVLALLHTCVPAAKQAGTLASATGSIQPKIELLRSQKALLPKIHVLSRHMRKRLVLHPCDTTRLASLPPQSWHQLPCSCFLAITLSSHQSLCHTCPDSKMLSA